MGSGRGPLLDSQAHNQASAASTTPMPRETLSSNRAPRVPNCRWYPRNRGLNCACVLHERRQCTFTSTFAKRAVTTLETFIPIGKDSPGCARITAPKDNPAAFLHLRPWFETSGRCGRGCLVAGPQQESVECSMSVRNP